MAFYIYEILYLSLILIRFYATKNYSSFSIQTPTSMHKNKKPEASILPVGHRLHLIGIFTTHLSLKETLPTDLIMEGNIQNDFAMFDLVHDFDFKYLYNS